MESCTTQLTLSDLVNAALGGTKLTNEHLGILQGVMLVLLKKLNSSNEQVTIYGLEGPRLKEILRTVQDPPYEIDQGNVQDFHRHFELLEHLEMKMNQLQLGLDKHFQDIKRRCSSNIYNAKYWDLYASPTEDLCTLYSVDNQKFCTMAQNPTFNEEIRRRMTRPVVERMKDFQHKLENMRQKLRDINEEADRVAEKLKLVEPMIGEIEDRRQEINKQWQTVREALQETQDMLNCKLDRIALPAMRKYLERRFETVDNHLDLLMSETTNCLPAKHVDVPSKDVCLSCSRNNDLNHRPVLDLRFPKQKSCQCVGIHNETTLLDRMDKIKVKTYQLVVMPTTSSLMSHDESSANAIAQELRDAGHYVHSYGSYNRHRIQDSIDLKPIITVVENKYVKSMQYVKSIDRNRSLISISGNNKLIAPIISNLSSDKVKSKPTNTKKPSFKMSISPKELLKHDF